MDKYIVDAVEEEGKFVLYASADITKDWHSGKYSYQILGARTLIDEGTLKVKANLLYSNDIDSFWRKALKQVEDRLAGKTLDPANDVSVGDKRVSYCSIDELLKLRNFILAKIAEEEQEEGDDSAVSPSDQKVIKYMWRSL